MKPCDLIFIVGIGTSLIVMAPTAEKAGQAEIANDAVQDVKVMPAQNEPATDQAKLVPASFDGDADKLTEH
jgi:hypothetical protein